MDIRSIGAAVVLAGMAGVAAADPVFTTSYGIEFSTISELGNPIVPESVGPGFYFNGQPLWQSGSVAYEYRIARTEAVDPVVAHAAAVRVRPREGRCRDGLLVARGRGILQLAP
jgi:hypothetical protein